MLCRLVFRDRRTPLFLLAVWSLQLCGCPDTKPQGDTKAIMLPFRGQEVELAVPQSLDLPTAWEVLLQEWSSQTGATVRWTEFSDDEAASLAKSLEGTSSSGGRVVLFSLRRLSELDQYLAPLDFAANPDFDPKDVFKGLRERVLSRERTPVAIPLAAPVLVCYYRSDLFKAAGLKPPATWDDYQSLVDTMEKWAPGLVAVEPLGLDHRAATFNARSLAFAKHPENYSVWFDLETGEPMMESAGFVEALEAAQRAWSRMPLTILEMSPTDCRRAVLEGRAALAIGSEPFARSDSSTEMVRTAQIEIGICRLPGSRRIFNRNSNRWEALPNGGVHAPGLCGFDGLALGITLPANSSKDAAAYNLLATLVGSQFDSAWASLPKTVCRESQISAAVAWNDGSLTAEEASQYIDAVAQTLRDPQLVGDFPLTAAIHFRGAMAQCVERVRTNKVEATAALTELQSQFSDIVTGLGKDTIRKSYRRGLGLATPTDDTHRPMP